MTEPQAPGASPGSEPGRWQDLVTASLLGTERVPVPATAVPGEPTRTGAGFPPDAAALPAEAAALPPEAAALSPDAAALSPDAAALPPDTAAELLDRAALLTVARRAGRLPDRAEPLAPADPEPLPAVSPAAAERLNRMLGGENPDLLTEWLAAVVTHGRRAPAQLLPALLERARKGSPGDPDLRRLVTQAGGSRARWLAALNPDWRFVTEHSLTGETAWRLGDASQRRGYLAALRAADPGAARDLAGASWATAGPERVMLVSVLADGLSLADEPLLEAALDDRADDVRGWAAYLLASLPGSALGRRMADRARRYLRLDHGLRGPRLLVSPPDGSDVTLRRDGITPGPGPGRSQLADRTRLMLEVLSRTPLGTWTEEFEMSPAQITVLPSGDWAPVLFAGWSRAASAQGRYEPRAQDWTAALITTALDSTARAGRPPGTAAETAALRQLARRADPALGAPGVLPGPEPGAPAVLYGATAVLRFRYEMLKELR